MIEVGRRVGVPMYGVGMPGHFLVQPAGELDVWFERLEHAESLLALGGACEVVEPASLRARMAAQARTLAERYRD